MALPFAAGRSVKSAAEMARRLQGRASAAHLRRRAADRRSPAAYTTAPGRARVAGESGRAGHGRGSRQHWRRIGGSIGADAALHSVAARQAHSQRRAAGRGLPHLERNREKAASVIASALGPPAPKRGMTQHLLRSAPECAPPLRGGTPEGVVSAYLRRNTTSSSAQASVA